MSSRQSDTACPECGGSTAVLPHHCLDLLRTSDDGYEERILDAAIAAAEPEEEE